MLDRIVLVGAGRTSDSLVTRLVRLAPLTVIDTAGPALEPIIARAAQRTDDAHPVASRVADGTSRLVLSDLRGDRRSSVGLVISPGDDRAALEATRLAVELEFAPVIAIVNDRFAAEACEKHGARVLLRSEIVGQLVEQTLLQGGLGVSSAIGFGRGELAEFRVLPSSPAIGVPLAQLRADDWRVAAIYRGEQLVLPVGTTRIQAEDRVLIVGDPKQLPHVAESLRVGLPTFPLLHGPNVVVYLPRGHDRDVETEAEVLTMRTRSNRMIAVVPHATGARRVVDDPASAEVRKHIEEADLPGMALHEHIATLRSRQPGVIVTKTEARTAADVLFGRGGRDAVLCNEIGVPVLFTRGSTHHERVLLCVTDGDADLGVAEIALDLARMFSVSLVVSRVKLPTYLQPEEEATQKLLEAIARRARLHGIEPQFRAAEGNPIAEWVGESRPSDLTIVARRPTTRDSFSTPDLALRVARKSRGSVLVVTVRP
jgi:Trk K+ transport system NAD-binding subunit/nucleotide-binding universal stress UspA family protein